MILGVCEGLFFFALTRGSSRESSHKAPQDEHICKVLNTRLPSSLVGQSRVLSTSGPESGG